MKNLIRGYISFRKSLTQKNIDTFLKHRDNQQPHTLFITCSDSRVLPSLITQTKVGELFLVKNVGNIIPPYISQTDNNELLSEIAAIEFALNILKIKTVILCGHSNCGAVNSRVATQNIDDSSYLNRWIKQIELDFLVKYAKDSSLSTTDQLSQANVIHQIKNLKSYPVVSQKINSNSLEVYGWWFDISSATIFSYSSEKNTFEPLA